MKTIPGIVGPAVLVVATALVTWFVITKKEFGSRVDLGDWDKLDNAFYSLVVRGRDVDLDALKQALADAKGSTSELAYCFSDVDKQGVERWHDEYPEATKCRKEDSPNESTDIGQPSMSVLSHKIYSISARDIERVRNAIKN